MIPASSVVWRRLAAAWEHPTATALAANCCHHQGFVLAGPLNHVQREQVASLVTSTSCSKAVEDGGPDAQPPATLSAEQLQGIQAAAGSACKHATKAMQLGTLTTLAGSYRDICVSMEAVYALQVQSQEPIHAPPVPHQPAAPTNPQLSSTSFPLLDVTQLPDDHSSVPPGPQQYSKQYMDRITCWLQTQPSHVETSMLLRTGISLFPPQEVTYPTYVDFQAATRLLERHKSRKRMALMKRIARVQDKYQLKTWDHHRGE